MKSPQLAFDNVLQPIDLLMTQAARLATTQGMLYFRRVAIFFTRKLVGTAPRQELYVYYRSRLLYKAWYVAGQKQYSKLFYEGEGLTQGAN